MIVVGSYGESPIKGAILGSTPHKLLHCPIGPCWSYRAAMIRGLAPVASPAA